ncbi:hypothetical protein [Actinoplanes sp. NPDC049265]|uniref:hypothetical protein n=1 Tax=Actinoplanes sp. NPDC049265 TaxID=3363902 RepID=UPI0037158690
MTDQPALPSEKHWDYDADLVDGFDYDTGAGLLRGVAVAGESELLTVLRDWRPGPSSFLYAWDTADPHDIGGR